MSVFSKDDILNLAKENDIKFIRLQFTDLLGRLKNVAITVEQLPKALENKCMFDGSSIDGFVRIEESDMYLKPDLDTFLIFPWRPQNGKVARLVCDVCNSDGTQFEGDPRYILKKVVKESETMGFSVNIGPEFEFFLFRTNEQGDPTTITHDKASYFDQGPSDGGEDARRDMCMTLEEMGFEIEASHHEVAHGQHEIDFKYSDPLSTADKIMVLKTVVKTVAKRHGLYATFMPKPIFGANGSGMHTNQSLFRDGINAFYDSNDVNGLSRIAYNYIAGLIKHAKSITAVTNPLVNSYKRLVPGFEAPVYIAWATKNRSPLIRIPAVKEDATRVEIRCPDPTCNPYLALAVIIAAGLDGIKNKLIPPKNVEENIFDLTDEQRKERGIERLPTNLYEALCEMKESKFVKDVLGEHAFKKYYEAKMLEWNNYSNYVHQWEIDEYLGRY